MLLRRTRSSVLFAIAASLLTVTTATASPDASPVACADQPPLADLVAASDDAGPGHAELLYAASVCAEQAGAVGDAIDGLRTLRARFATSAVAAPALARLGALHARTGDHAAAAAALEEYASKYPTRDDAATALGDATRYRRALGDDARVIANTTTFIRVYGGKRPGEAARAFFDLASIYERSGKPDAVLRHYRAYLKTYGAKGGADLVVIANARIGQILWDASCRSAIDGACVALAPAAAAQCGPAAQRPLRTVARDRRQVAAATAAFAAASRAYQAAGGAFGAGDAASARHHHALARFHLAELDHEAFLALPMPAGLNFDPADPVASRESTARFTAWLTDKRRLGDKAQAGYLELVTEIRDPELAIAGAARSGQLALHFVDSLHTLEVPAFLRSYPDAVEAFCRQLTEVAEPFEATAISAFEQCVRTSSNVGMSSTWTKLCERELSRLSPEDHPATRELPPTTPPAPTSVR